MREEWRSVRRAPNRLQELQPPAPPRGFELLQVVHARKARPDLGVRKGDSGTIVEVFDRPHRAYYVEIVNDDGTTRAEGAFTAGDLIASPPAL
jgi:hypothetical protein